MPTSASQSLRADVALFLNPENNEQDQHRRLQDIAAKIQSGSSSINDLVGQTVSTNACRRSIMRVQPLVCRLKVLVRAWCQMTRPNVVELPCSWGRCTVIQL